MQEEGERIGCFILKHPFFVCFPKEKEELKFLLIMETIGLVQEGEQDEKALYHTDGN